MKNLYGIENIIFDLGGILLNTDRELTEQAFRELAPEKYEAAFATLEEDGVFEKFETGQLSVEDFRKAFKAQFPEITDEQIDEAWNKMILDIPVEHLDLLKTLKPHFHVYLLSNTNPIHIEKLNNDIKEKHGIEEGLAAFFDEIYLSFEMKLRKPNYEAFEYVLHDKGMLPENSFFIDDLAQNVVAAEGAGIHAYCPTEKETLIGIFKELKTFPEITI